MDVNAISTKAARNRYVPWLIGSIVLGVTRPIMKLHIQVDEVISDITFDLLPRL